MVRWGTTGWLHPIFWQRLEQYDTRLQPLQYLNGPALAKVFVHSGDPHRWAI
jgi:hypothetical protein